MSDDDLVVVTYFPTSVRELSVWFIGKTEAQTFGVEEVRYHTLVERRVEVFDEQVVPCDSKCRP